LIALNINATFSCRDKTKLQDKKEKPKEEKAEEVVEAGQIQEKEADVAEQVEAKEPTEATKLLGQFTIRGADPVAGTEELNKGNPKSQPAADRSKDSSSAFLPLVVQRHKGAQFNSSHQVNTVVLDNAQVFASNYARPEFYFRHLHGHAMTIDKITIRTWPAPRAGAYPAGCGLIFMADSLEAFERTKPFHKFTAEDYKGWKAKRALDPRPLRPCEPVSFFEFDEKPSITIEIDFKRECRFIMLKPTGFRVKPHHFRQSPNELPMELEFFGVHGSS
jgi:hypothetical protein